jgi:hypothetical protein
MSKRIEEILEVVEEVRGRFESQPGLRYITPARVEAVKSVARRRGIAYHTVNDKFRRQLEPDIAGVAEFDKLLEDWLVSGSLELRDILLKNAVDEGDISLINQFFYEAAGSEDALLADEFGYDPRERDFVEGKLRLRLHLAKERSRSLVDRAKKNWMRQQGGNPRCSICSFSFWDVYGGRWRRLYRGAPHLAHLVAGGKHSCRTWRSSACLFQLP